MKYLYIFTTLVTLIINVSLYSMNNDTFTIDPLQMPLINFTHAAFLNNKILALAGNKGLVFFDIATNCCTHHYQKDTAIDDLVASKTKCATSCNGLLTIYDIATQEKDWEYNTHTNTYTPITFDSQNDEQLITHICKNQLLLLNGPDTIQTYTTSDKNAYSPITCHPHHTSVIYNTISFSYKKRAPKTHNIKMFSIPATKEENNSKDEILSSKRFGSHLSWTISTDAQYIIIQTHYTGSMDDTLAFGNLKTGIVLPAAPYIKALFHPSSKIFITLSHDCSTNSYKLNYWKYDDTDRLNIIFTCNILTKNNSKTSSPHIAKSLAISPDGAFLAIATDKNFFLIRIPFELINKTLYEHGAKEKCMAALTMFNHYEAPYIPSDITAIIITTLLKLHRYKYSTD